jgi:hypothetical protein
VEKKFLMKRSDDDPKVLLVEPDFPSERKSKNHHQLLPLGLLKLASYHRSLGNHIQLVRGCTDIDYEPDKVLITSLFTYWSKYVWEAVAYYKRKFPRALVEVGGIYATLMPEHCKQSGCDEVYVGVHQEAECFQPAYDLVNTEFQIVHTSRGCVRNCAFCGVWKVEPQFTFKGSVKGEICKNYVIFYDNNLLANPNIEKILEELASIRIGGRSVVCESQCGIDGLLLTTDLAKLLRKAHFLYPRIAWDHKHKNHEQIKAQIGMLVSAGYHLRDIYVFMLYNYELGYEELDRKRQKCLKWGVQIADCRYRPLNQTFDNYNPLAWRIGQTGQDYYIHPNWTDAQIRKFRKQVREQNIVIRHGFTEYSRDKELAGREKKTASGGHH